MSISEFGRSILSEATDKEQDFEKPEPAKIKVVVIKSRQEAKIV